MVECFLAKEDVAGSNPVSRSNQARLALPLIVGSSAASAWRYGGMGRGTQVVRERSAKPLCVGSIPTRASNSADAESVSLYPKASTISFSFIVYRWHSGVLSHIGRPDHAGVHTQSYKTQIDSPQ